MTLESTYPIRGYLLVEPERLERKRESGLILADMVKGERPQTGKVLKVGAPQITDSGAIIPSPVIEGANILFKKWGGNEVKLDGEEYFFIRFDDVLGVC
jgi:chaperonin GroES